MASYTAQQLKGAGTAIEKISAAKTFDLTNPSNEDAYFTVEQVMPESGYFTAPGVLVVNSELTLIGFFTTTVDQSVDVTINSTQTSGDGDGAVIRLTSSGGVFTSGEVINGGTGFVVGEVITISQADLITLGFANANNPANLRVLFGDLEATNARGVYSAFTNISASTLITSSYISSVVVPSGVSSYIFDPSAGIAISSSMLRATGGITLVIS